MLLATAAAPGQSNAAIPPATATVPIPPAAMTVRRESPRGRAGAGLVFSGAPVTLAIPAAKLVISSASARPRQVERSTQ